MIEAVVRYLNFSVVMCALLCSLFCVSAQAANVNDPIFPSKTVYFGVNIGGGSTEWKYLVDTADPGGSPSTPSGVTEGGPSWGGVFGYDVSKNFAVELQYMQFANAHVQLLSEGSPYVYPDDTNILGIVSKTDAYSLSGKFFAQVWRTHLRAFAAVGVGVVERRDPLVDYQQGTNPPPYSNYTGKNKLATCVTPYLSSGLTYNFTRHWMLESGFQYYTGFGKSQINPVSGFIPFAWDAYGRLAYQL